MAPPARALSLSRGWSSRGCQPQILPDKAAAREDRSLDVSRQAQNTTLWYEMPEQTRLCVRRHKRTAASPLTAQHPPSSAF